MQPHSLKKTQADLDRSSKYFGVNLSDVAGDIRNAVDIFMVQTQNMLKNMITKQYEKATAVPHELLRGSFEKFWGNLQYSVDVRFDIFEAIWLSCFFVPEGLKKQNVEKINMYETLLQELVAESTALDQELSQLELDYQMQHLKAMELQSQLHEFKATDNIDVVVRETIASSQQGLEDCLESLKSSSLNNFYDSWKENLNEISEGDVVPTLNWMSSQKINRIFEKCKEPETKLGTQQDVFNIIKNIATKCNIKLHPPEIQPQTPFTHTNLNEAEKESKPLTKISEPKRVPSTSTFKISPPSQSPIKTIQKPTVLQRTDHKKKPISVVAESVVVAEELNEEMLSPSNQNDPQEDHLEPMKDEIIDHTEHVVHSPPPIKTVKQTNDELIRTPQQCTEEEVPVISEDAPPEVVFGGKCLPRTPPSSTNANNVQKENISFDNHISIDPYRMYEPVRQKKHTGGAAVMKRHKQFSRMRR